MQDTKGLVGRDGLPSQQAVAKLRNPLDGLSREQIRVGVEQFVAEKGLTEHVDVIYKGALVAQSPQSYETISELSDHHRQVLRHEQEHRWSHPFMLYLTIALCSIGAAVQGWDQTGSNGGMLTFRPDIAHEH